MKTVHVGLVFGAFALGPATPVSSQTVSEADSVGYLTGVVRDEASNQVLEGARIRVVGLGRGMLTDSLGHFEFSDLPSGPQLITVEQYGFDGRNVIVDVTERSTYRLEVLLHPRPVMLEGLTVVAERLAEIKKRLRNRLRAAPVSTRALDQDRLLRTAAVDVLEFLRFEGSLRVVPCGMDARSRACVMRRGRSVEPRVCIDEMPAFGALDQLSTYRPQELYRIEVYSSGAEIRAYTHQFMERMASGPKALIPYGFAC